MDWIIKRLNIDSQAIFLDIQALLKSKLEQMQRDGILIGLSGGLDSAVVAYLAVKAVGKDKVSLLNLPDRDSKAIHRQHAALIGRELGVELETIEITPFLRAMGVYDLLPIGFLPGQNLRDLVIRFGKSITRLTQPEDMLAMRFHPTADSLVAKANAYAMAKHRLRMVLLYRQAEIHNLMVVGAADRTEWLTGTFSQWGCDQCADVMPIVHLYRSQLHALAEYLNVPEAIRTKAADPDIIPGVNDKEQLLGSFLEADQIL